MGKMPEAQNFLIPPRSIDPGAFGPVIRYLLALAIILVSKQCYNRKSPSRGHRQDGSVMNSSTKIALTQGLLALQSQVLLALAIIIHVIFSSCQIGRFGISQREIGVSDREIFAR